MVRESFVSAGWTAGLAGLAVLSAAAILAPQIGYGTGLGWDPVNYLCTARNMLAGEGFFGCGGRSFSPWAPGYPAMLAAAGGFIARDPYDVAGPINAAAFGALVFVAGQWLLRNLESRVLAVLGCLAVASSPPLMGIASYAYSETAFLLFTALALTRADRYFDDRRAASLAWAAAFTALACATRYAGVVIAAVIAAGLVLERRGSPRRKAMRLWAYGLASAAPVCAWMLRNLIEEGWFFMPRVPVDHPLPEVLADTARTVGGWMLHDARPHGALGAAALLLLAAGAGWRGLRALPRVARPRERSFLLFGGFVLAYAVFYAYTAVAGHHEHGVQARHLFPMYFPILFAALLEADRLASCGRETRGTWTRAAAAGLLLWLSWGVYPSIRDVLSGRFPAYSSIGSQEYADSRTARRSEVVRYLRADVGRGGTVWSNAKDWLEIHAGGMAAHAPLPAGREEHSDAAGALAEWFDARVRGGDRIVWLHGERRRGGRSYGADDLRALPGAIPLADLKDGLVLRKETFTDIARPGASLVVGGPFELRIDAGGKWPIPIDSECRRMDPDAALALHAVPVRVSDLPRDRRVWRFDNLDSELQRNRSDDDGCSTFAKFPDYEIAHIRIGQSTGARSTLWSVEVL